MYAQSQTIVTAQTPPVVQAFIEPEAATIAAPPVLASKRHVYAAQVFHDIESVEHVWRSLASGELESPGQSYDFIRLWIEDRRIAGADQHYVVGTIDGEPVAILPLQRKRLFGIRVFTWFPGSQAGCYAPIADTERLAALGAAGRASLWRSMSRSLAGADLVYLRSVPASIGRHEGLFDELGSSLAVDTLYRAEFPSWEDCDSQQRSRSRRKHDRQQGDRLAALGDVAFEHICDPVEAHAAVDIMFAQRSARFREQGIRDAFVADRLVGFYHKAIEAGSGIDVRLHALRLDGQIVAVRYNIVAGGRMFCLISSMADCDRIQSGSPGKQCLLRVMQTVFDAGITVFDMGCGYTDEKRHWCNVQIALRQHYLGLTPVGTLAAAGHRAYQRVRAWAKTSPGVKSLRRKLAHAKDRLSGGRVSDQL